MTNGTSQAEVMSNSEKIKPLASAIIKLRLCESISQPVSYEKFLNKRILKFRSNF